MQVTPHGNSTPLTAISPESLPIKVGFILGALAFEDIYGEESTQAVAPMGDLLNPPITTEQLESESHEWIGEVEALFTGWGAPRLDEAMLKRMPRLRAVFHGAGTLRSIVTEACWPREILFTSAALQNSIPTAEFAFGMILLSLKRVWHNAAFVKQHRTFPVHPQHLPMPGAYGSVVGITSLGKVGRSVIRRLQSLEVKVIAYDPFALPSTFQHLGITPCSLEELFASSDVVSLHTPLLPETRGGITGALLGLLKPNATFINTARGALVNEPELIAFLQARPDVQAILDVTDPEPPAADSPLWELPNVFLTPHIAGSLGPECRRMGKAMVEEFHRYARGAPLHYGVTREQLAHMA
jgi:phosphoglycerate dehydrogenase-like enzyme